MSALSDMNTKLGILQENQSRTGFKLFNWEDILNRMEFLNIVGLQPMKNPVDQISYFSRAIRIVSDVPEIRVDIVQRQIEAESRRFSDKADEADIASLIDREIMSTILESCRLNQVFTSTTNELSAKLQEARYTIHKNSQRKPGEWIALNPETLKHLCNDDRGRLPDFKIFFDTKFPTDTILMGMLPGSDVDAGIVWSPYCYSANKQEGGFIDTLIRQKITLVNISHFWSINLKESSNEAIK